MSDIPYVRDSKLHRPDGGLVCAVGSRTGWLDWLEDRRHTSFRYEDADGRSCSMVKERRKGSTGVAHYYWYAHKQVRSELKRIYLGRSVNVTIARLEQAIGRLYQLGLPLEVK